MREGQQSRGCGRLLVFGDRCGGDFVDGAEGAVLALFRRRWGDEVAELGGQREEVWDGRCGWLGGGVVCGFEVRGEALEVLGGEGFVEGWGGGEGGADGGRLGLVGHCW